MPVDGDPGNVERTGLAINDIADRLRGSGAGNVILMLDACRSEDDRDGGEGIGLETQQGVITLFACSPSESSYEIDELQQGAFTHSLLQGLRIQGEGNCATVERLYQHLQYQVPQLNARYNKRRQTPYAVAEPATKLHLILLPAQATLQDVLQIKNDALEAEAESDWELAEQLWIRAFVASPGDRQAVKGLQRVALKRVQQPPSVSSPPVTAGSRRIEAPVSEAKPEPQVPTFSFEVVTVDRKGAIAKKETRQAEYRREALEQGVELEMVAIPGGTFKMGSADGQGDDDERPQHSVTVKSFLVGKYPVTQAQWKAIAALPKVKCDLKADPSNFKGDSRPVEYVYWDDAVEFCHRLSKHTSRKYRLPSEAEWEYACRAGTTTPFHFGETVSSNVANYNANYTYGDGQKGEYREQTTDVGSFPANAFGLYDMHGNVWEWCLDHWHENYTGTPTNGGAWLSGDENAARLLRGGSWSGNTNNCRSAKRDWYPRDYGNGGLGFRVVCAASWPLV